MHVAIRRLVCAMLAVGMFLVPRMGSAQETGEKSAELAQFEKDVALLRGPQSAPATGMFLALRMVSAQERAQVPACQQARTGEKSAELAQFEKDVALLRGPQDAPATPAAPGMCLNVVSPATLLDGRVAAEEITAQVTSFVVWLDNQSSSYLTTRLYWRDVYSSNIHQTAAGVSPGQVVPHTTSACGTVIAYMLDVYQNGYYIGSTGATEPNASDGYPCADAWGISQ